VTGLWAGWCRNAELELAVLNESVRFCSHTGDLASLYRRIDTLSAEIAAVRQGLKEPSIVLMNVQRYQGRTSPRYSPQP